MRYKDFLDWKYLDADSSHPLEWKIESGNSPRAIVLISDVRFPETGSVRGIRVYALQREDGRYALYFIEEDPDIHPIFVRFCDDVINYTRNVKPEEGPSFAVERFNKWKKAFKNPKTLLSEIEIQGLIGEIIAMRDVLFKRYGQKKTLRAWMNRYHSKQDFMPEDVWYEVKSAIYGSKTVTVTSLEQLDRSDEGHMIVVFLSVTGPDFAGKITISSLVDEMERIIADPEALELFNGTLEEFGYCWNPEYEKYCYELRKISEYAIGEEFPRLTKSDVKSGITEATYKISLDSIDRFRV